jgi:hypothetical protein
MKNSRAPPGLGPGRVPTSWSGKKCEELHLIGTVTQHIGLVTLKVRGVASVLRVGRNVT